MDRLKAIPGRDFRLYIEELAAISADLFFSIPGRDRGYCRNSHSTHNVPFSSCMSRVRQDLDSKVVV